MSKTLGLALGSGGSRGVCHAGFLLALEEKGINPDYIAGCSMGAVVGGCYASGMSAAEMKQFVTMFKPRDIMDINPTAVITKMSILRSKKIRDLLVTHIGTHDIKDMKIPFKCVATELYSGKLHIFEEGDAALAVQASSTVPTIFRPVAIDGKLFVDGGCLCRVPVKIVKDMGADVVIAVDALENAAEPVDKVHNIVTMVLRIFDIMDANQTSQMRQLEDGICDLLIEPDMAGLSQYAIKDALKAFEAGYAAGKENIQKIKQLLE